MNGSKLIGPGASASNGIAARIKRREVGAHRRRDRCGWNIARIWWLLALSGGCGGVMPTGAGSGADFDTEAADTAIDTPSFSCDAVTQLFAASDILAEADHPCFAWIDETRGRVIRSTPGSAVVWSRRNEAEAALMATALHTLGEGWFAPVGEAIAESTHDPSDQEGVARLFLVSPDGSEVNEQASRQSCLYNPAVPADENGDSFINLLPRHDFIVGVVDTYRFESGTNAAGPVLPDGGMLPLYDPAGVTTSAFTWAGVSAGELVLIAGYPTHGDFADELAAVVGRVLSDDEAHALIPLLDEAGDAEGAIPYDSESEMIIEGAAASGMSGGAVFDRDRRLVGIIVRGSDRSDDRQFVRAVRMSFIVSELERAVAALPASDAEAIARFLEPR
ncbi:MAG: trypsin-like peptidase domain-containing protein [Planctomycetes bacterium]|nr:trypsin-like peptidase domain-containing protein [Planctomycetota bacterium]